MQLIFPTLAHKIAALDYRQEFFNHGVTAIDGDAGLDEAPSYKFWLEVVQSAPTRVHERYAPSSTFFAMVDDKIVGMVDIRHHLTDYLICVGGHIGYSVRPCERRKGYATKMLAMAVEKSRTFGIEKVLVTCNKDNISSAKTILRNGGVMENEFTEENGNVVQRYWITL